MKNNFLQEIVDYKRKHLKSREALYGTVKKAVNKSGLSRYGLFKKSISKPGRINLIAEIKKASPSQGLIREDFDVEKIAKIYAQEGADAISILTEDKFFLGKLGYLRRVGDVVRLPLLRKDFIIDETQIYESFHYGASALLLIVAILGDAQIKDFIQQATQFDMDCLVEVHDEGELDRALKCGAEIIGINNRDLQTFGVNLQVSERLIPLIPKDKVVVVESGLKTHAQIEQFKELGAHAVLIGETFMRETDIARKVQEIMSGK